ncbi:MAG TPA: TetR/AcrR family transcriptional regulator [Rhodospirillaceae bacterium]|nr:TetR/AcrR family transcriptional regulator [Rhodospirillaceae bacterium]
MARPKRTSASADEGATSKRQSILAAARQIFLENGYGKASMDAVAARAAVSKATIYAHFSSKRVLFEAIIGQRCEAIFAPIGLPENITDGRQALLHLATHFLTQILAPEAISIHRVVVGESPHLPEVGEAFYAAGPAVAHQRVARLFGELGRLGYLALPEAQIPVITDLFLAMLKGDIHTRALLNLPPGHRTVQTMAEAAVDLVLARYRAGNN